MRNISDVNCLHSLLQVEKSVNQWINTYSLMTRAITTVEQFSEQDQEEYYKFCLIPFLKLINQLNQLSDRKMDICMKYTDAIDRDDIDNPEYFKVDEAIYDIKTITRNIYMKELLRHELEEALNTISHQVKNIRNRTEGTWGKTINNPGLIWTDHHVFKKGKGQL